MIEAFPTRRGMLALSGALALHAGGAMAQGLPRTVRLIVPYPPGGASDITARLLAQEMTLALGSSFVIENRGGAASITGTQAIATAAPDGATVGVVDTAFLVNPGLFAARLPYDTQKDFSFISMLVRSPLLLVVPAQSLWKDVAQLVQAAKDKPGELAFGSAGNGSAVHMAGEQLRLAADFTYVHVPYRGGGPMITDLLAGRVQMAFGTVPAMAEHVRAGRLRALAVTGATRARLMPEIPSMAEAGQPKVDAALMNGLVGPAGLPPPLVETLARGAHRVLTGDAMRARLLELGFEPVASTPDEFRDYGVREIAQWQDVVRRSGIQPE